MFHEKFELGTCSQGPGEFRFFRLNAKQLDDQSVETDATDKLEASSYFVLLRTRRGQSDSEFNSLEKKHYASVNSSLCWLGNVASPLWAFYSSYLQQKAPDILVKHIMEPNHVLKSLKRWGKTVRYCRPKLNVDTKLSLLVFANASKSDECGQIKVLCGLLFGNL